MIKVKDLHPGLKERENKEMAKDSTHSLKCLKPPLSRVSSRLIASFQINNWPFLSISRYTYTLQKIRSKFDIRRYIFQNLEALQLAGYLKVEHASA